MFLWRLICGRVAPVLQMFTVVNCSAVYYLYFEEPLRHCSVLPLNLYSNAAVVLSYAHAPHYCSET
jgi:hypothetical protein